MKYNILILLAFIFTYCNNNNDENLKREMAHVDSLAGMKRGSEQYSYLAQYTYPIENKFQGTQSGSGSCFFYRNGKKKYLVTNMHIFTGISYFRTDSVIYEYHIDTNVLRLESINSNVSIQSIPISKYSHDLKKRLSIQSEVDLYKIEIEIPDSVKVNFINDLIDTSFFDKKPDSIFQYGFDGDIFDGYHSDLYWITANPSLVSGRYSNYYDWDRLEMGFSSKFRKLDDSMANNYFFITSRGKTGMSGSPVFGKYHIVSNGIAQDVIKFAGVMFAIEKNQKYNWVINSKVVFKYLNSNKN